MKNTKALKGLFASTLALTLLLTGCSKNESSSFGTYSSNVPERTEPDEPNNSGMQSYGKVVSVEDIKKSYGSLESDDVMPLYNVEPNETFEFTFKADWLDISADVDPTDLVSVHTDPACTEQSKLYTSNLFDEEDPKKLCVSPIGGPLATDTEDTNMIENDVEVWGNAQMYYIAIWYDTEADSFVKLDKPVVIPFTVKHELGVPTVKGNVDKDGRFKLTWDAVEGATGYRIYKFFSTEINNTGTVNKPVAGAEKAFDLHGDCYLIRDAETTETEFDCFAGKDHGLAIHYHDELDEDDVDYILGQNYCVNGSYFVTALFGDKESSLSNIVDTDELILPYKPVDEDDLMFKKFDTEADLPHTVRVLNINGSVTERNVSYKFHWGKTLIGTDYPQYRYSIEGTAITGECSMDILDGKAELYKDKQEGDAPAGFVDNSTDTSAKADPENNTPFNPDSSVPTIIESKPTTPEENSGEPESKPESEPTSEPDPVSDPESKPTLDPGGSDKPLAERQIENTKEHIKNGDKKIVEQTEYAVFAESAEEEWLARNLIAGCERIPLDAFPALQQYDTLADVFQKVYYQNPYVLGVVSYRYDYATLTLCVEYCYDDSELEQKQSEILNSANEIIKQTITDEMSAEDKCRAFYDYFNNNTTYDDAAVEAVEKSNFKKGGGWKEHEDAFNAHGVLADKKGVCQSYALSYKLLCSMSGVESRVITGYLNGDLPHAWNSVKLDDKWYQTDCTNNSTNCGIPFFLYEAGEDDLAMTGYTEDKLYDLDTAVGTFSVPNSEREYYSANGLCANSADEFKAVLGRCLDNSDKTIAIRISGDGLSKDDVVKAVKEVYNMKGMENKLAELGFGYANSFVILIEK